MNICFKGAVNIPLKENGAARGILLNGIGETPPRRVSLSKTGPLQSAVLSLITKYLFCDDYQFPIELAPPLVALPFDLPDVRKEKRLMRRREKLPDFLRLLLGAAAKLLPMLEMSSWDWLRLESFSRYLLRKSNFDPLCRKPTAGR